MSNENKKCKVHYTGTFNDGTKFDSSYDRGEPLEFVCGAGMMIKGFDEAVKDMEVGQIVDVHLMPEEAYGMPNPENVFTLEISQLPGSEGLSVGERVYLSNAAGQPFPVSVAAKDETTITFDANHEMAGKELEVGYWIGVPFWGQGLIPEAVRAIQEYAFDLLGCDGLWCGYYEGNEKSRRVQEKCGFQYHHTEKDKPCPLMGEVRTEYFTYLSKEQWEKSAAKEGE